MSLENHFKYSSILFKPEKEKKYINLNLPKRISRALVNLVPEPKGKGKIALDLGCGESLHRYLLETIGYEYIGIDYDSKETPILADAHALPFKDNSFDLIFSVAVLEHIQYPFIMIEEAFRVLKPGGKIVGSVAFLEPFHQNSYYHHTHRELYNTLKEPGFIVEKILINKDWPGLLAISSMGLFPKMPLLIVKTLTILINTFHMLWWYIGKFFNKKAASGNRALFNSGSFFFLARK